MTTVRIRVVDRTEVVVEVASQFGDAAGVARRLRSEGVNARQSKGEVIVTPQPSSTTEVQHE